MYDLIVIGAGPAGITAALYAARSNLKVATIEQGAPGGQMNNTADIENYPGFELISGPELSMKMYEPLAKMGVENIYGIVTSIEDKGSYKIVKTDDNIYETKTVIIATGAKHRLLGAPGEDTFSSRGVSYCAICDGAFFRDQDLLVVGGGDSAVEESIFLARLAKSVTIVHRRDELRAQKVLQERAFTNDKIKFIWDTVVKEIKGDNVKVKSVVFENVKTKEITEQEFGGVFIYVGLIPVSSIVSNLGITDESGWIITDENMKTKIPGIFAVGDVRQKSFRQITTSVADGAIAAQNVYQYVIENS
ncbi:thioredoxin-disulfide reductase [Streptococcus marimammalium]|uniref:thioredoxin-disulfide reductase n=1 Tax=Streptococcus marimammalium TaxID=269666 RepID=UPI0003684ABF|nr:thioredoxin-disulfide reductase [Streptococcus marimammalium]